MLVNLRFWYFRHKLKRMNYIWSFFLRILIFDEESVKANIEDGKEVTERGEHS